MNTFKDHFSGDSAGYAAHRPDYPPELFAHLAGLAPSHELAWDCATGSGQAAHGLAPYFRQVQATDASASQIAQARPRDGVSYRVATAEASGLARASVDLITVAQAAHWFDLPRFHAEARRVLRPGGVVALWCYERLSIAPELDAVIARFYAETLGPYWPPERRHVEAGYRDLDFPYAELPAPPLAMEARWNLDQLLGYFATWSAVKAYRAARGEDPLPPLRAELEGLWVSHGAAKTIKWPLSLRLGHL